MTTKKRTANRTGRPSATKSAAKARLLKAWKNQHKGMARGSEVADAMQYAIDAGLTGREIDAVMDRAHKRAINVGRVGEPGYNRAGKVGGVKLARHPRHKHLGVSQDGNIRAGRVHSDRFYSFDELPLDIQKDYADWAQEDTQFVRRSVKLRGGGVGYDFTPLENFQHTPSGKAPSGRPADGFASDSYFSGTAIKMIRGGEGSDHEYQVWLESW